MGLVHEICAEPAGVAQVYASGAGNGEKFLRRRG